MLTGAWIVTTPGPTPSGIDRISASQTHYLSWLSRCFGEAGVGAVSVVRALSRSGGVQDAPPEEIEIGPAVHLSFEDFDPVHVALHLSLTPLHGEPSPDRCRIS